MQAFSSPLARMFKRTLRLLLNISPNGPLISTTLILSFLISYCNNSNSCLTYLPFPYPSFLHFFPHSFIHLTNIIKHLLSARGGSTLMMLILIQTCIQQVFKTHCQELGFVLGEKTTG